MLSVLNSGCTITRQGDDESLYPKNKPTILAAILQTLPGIQSLNLPPLDLTLVSTSASPADSPLFGPLAAAAAQAEADAERARVRAELGLAQHLCPVPFGLES